MKEYKIYTGPRGAREAVKQGWSWPAFFFTTLWALLKRMWALGLGVMALFIALGVAEAGMTGEQGAMTGIVTNILSLAASIVFGRFGNTWRERNLLGRGYRHVDTVSAATPEGAVALWEKERPEAGGDGPTPTG